MQKQEQPGVRTLDEAEGYEERNRWNEEAEPKDSEDSDDTVDGDDSDDSDKKDPLGFLPLSGQAKKIAEWLSVVIAIWLLLNAVGTVSYTHLTLPTILLV